ncbi:MAG: hypothetical protein K6F99_00965, partial [Lachnospiraceae bacterium]|nr:hypothetical protein [Lachnospiraceae bacterium]
MADNNKSENRKNKDKSMFTIYVAVIVSFIFAIFVSIASMAMFARENTKEIDTMLTYRIYDSIASSLNEPIIVAETMACNGFMVDFLNNEGKRTEQEAIDVMKDYLSSIKNGLEYDSAFLVSEKSHRYYTYEGLNKIIDPIHDGHDVWYTLFVNQN